MQQLNERQQKIIGFISKNKTAGNSRIAAFLGNEVTRFTVLRDLELLLKVGLIKKEGKGRAVRYLPVAAGDINAFFDPNIYFAVDQDQRSIKSVFEPKIIDELQLLFSKQEIGELKKINDKYLEKIKKADESFFRKEVERLTIDLSWKSSRLEGNTYSLFDTEVLIKERIEAKGHQKEESIMILNHKNAIDHIFKQKCEFEKLDLFHIEKIHELLTRGLKVRSGIRNIPVRIIGTRYLPLSGKTKIINALDLAIAKINALADPFSKALAVVLMISYIQPFEDGNKRTARIIANAMLLANNVCPISYRSVDEVAYKKAVVLFYEQNSARFFKELFVEQFKFAVDNYF
jgi:fido (protein-threonine AMPylation protein)